MSTSFSLSGLCLVSAGNRPAIERSRVQGNGRDYIIDLGPLDVGTKSCWASGMFERGRIVARFGSEGKPVPARKSRIFNHLSYPFRRSLAATARSGNQRQTWAAPGTTVVLVEQGEPMIATRPDKAFLPIKANFDTKPGLRSLQEIFS